MDKIQSIYGDSLRCIALFNFSIVINYSLSTMSCDINETNKNKLYSNKIESNQCHFFFLNLSVIENYERKRKPKLERIRKNSV